MKIDSFALPLAVLTTILSPAKVNVIPRSSSVALPSCSAETSVHFPCSRSLSVFAASSDALALWTIPSVTTSATKSAVLIRGQGSGVRSPQDQVRSTAYRVPSAEYRAQTPAKDLGASLREPGPWWVSYNEGSGSLRAPAEP